MKPPGVDLPRRFYKAASVQPKDSGATVRLDGRTPKSPGGKALATPTKALAQVLADEWGAQGEHIVMASMPATRLAHTALDAVPAARRETAAEVARYAGSDALCYLAEAPQALVARQLEGWTPILEWARAELGVALATTNGVMHHAQSPDAISRVQALAADLDDFRLAGVAFATALFGSAILAFAVQRRRLTGLQAFDLSRLDEAFQEEQWGVDEEAAQRTARLRRDAAMIEAWFAALAA